MEITAASIQLGKSKDTRFKGWAKISIDGILQITGIRFYENFNPETNEHSRYFRFPEYQTNPNSTGGGRVGDLFTAEFVFVMRETVISYFLCAFYCGAVAGQ